MIRRAAPRGTRRHRISASPGHAETIVIFARCPDPGRCKKRLIPEFGPDGATLIHHQLLSRTLRVVNRSLRLVHRQVLVVYTGEAVKQLRDCVRTNCPSARQIRQSPGAPETRMLTGFQTAGTRLHDRCVAVGTDCPSLTVEILNQAFETLRQRPMVIGPAETGGFYLLGLSRIVPEVFHRLSQEAGRVALERLAILRSLHRQVGLLPRLSEVAHPEDLSICRLLSLDCDENPVWERESHRFTNS